MWEGIRRKTIQLKQGAPLLLIWWKKFMVTSSILNIVLLNGWFERPINQ